MKIFRLGEDPLQRDNDSSVTIGTFDGVHLGHRSILEKVLAGGHSTVVTFYPHPQLVIHNKPGNVPIITPLAEKLRKLEAVGIERTIIIPFDRKFASISAGEFLRDILFGVVGLKRLVVGFNHAFGRGREGNADFLRRNSDRFGFELFVIGPYSVSGKAVSSSLIRRTLVTGDVSTANSYLGNPFRLIGTVIRGDGRGRGLGYPTANLSLLEPHQVVPAEGVYSARIILGEKAYPGVVSIGTSPTFGDGPLAIEAHLFDVDFEMYGKVLAVEFVDYLRGQEKFSSPEELTIQMRRDELEARKSLGLV